MTSLRFRPIAVTRPRIYLAGKQAFVQHVLMGVARETSSRLRWLHRIGYLCTLLIAIEIVWTSTLFGMAWWHDRERRAEAHSRSRVRSGPLLLSDVGIYTLNRGLSRLGAIAPVAKLGADSVRLGADAALGKFAYALAMRRRGIIAEGAVVVFEPRSDATEARTTYRFQAPIAEYQQVMAQVDGVLDGYEGGDRLCTDGVDYAVERRRGGSVYSGTSFSTCDRTYEEAAILLVDFARRFTPLPRWLGY